VFALQTLRCGYVGATSLLCLLESADRQWRQPAGCYLSPFLNPSSPRPARFNFSLYSMLTTVFAESPPSPSSDPAAPAAPVNGLAGLAAYGSESEEED